MHFAGAHWSTLLALGIGAGLGMLGLYLLRLRRRRVQVAFAPLWQKVLGDRDTSRLSSRLKQLISLLIQWGLLACLLLAFGDLRCTSEAESARNVIVLIDTSASMGATDVQPARLGLAQREALNLLEGLGSEDRALIASVDATVTPRTTLTSDLVELRRAVESLTVTDTAAQVARALEFSRDILRGQSRPEVVFLSDGAFVEPANLPDLGEVHLSYVPFGTSSANVAISAFSVRRYPLDRARYEVLLELNNTGEETAQVHLSLEGDGHMIQSEQLELPGGGQLRRIYKDLSGVDGRLEAHIEATSGLDWLEADNHAYALLTPRQHSRVLVVGPGNAYLEAALLLDEFLEVVTVAEGDAAPEGKFDLTIFDGTALPAEPRLGALLYLGLPAQSQFAPLKSRKRIEQFGFDRHMSKSPLLRWISPENIQVLHGDALSPEKGDRVVGASDQGPILVAGARGGQPFVILGFDPRNSDFVLRVGWPLFILNVLEHFAEAEGDYLSSLRTGQAWSLPVSGSTASVSLTEPSGNVRDLVVREGRATFTGQHSGFYRLDSGSEFAANLGDVRESHIAPRGEWRLDNRAVPAPPEVNPQARQTLWGWLLIAALVLSGLEWFSYHRRWTV